MASNVKSLRNLLNDIEGSMVRCANKGIEGYCKLTASGNLDWIRENEKSARAKITHPSVEKYININAGVGKEVTHGQDAEYSLVLVMKTKEKHER